MTESDCDCGTCEAIRADRVRRTIPYDWARISCPKCGAGPDEYCRTLTTNRTTDAHERRRQLAQDPFGPYKKPRQCSECKGWFPGEHFCWAGTP